MDPREKRENQVEDRAFHLLKALPQQESVPSEGSSIETGGGSPFIMVGACERAFSLKMLLWLSRTPHCHPGIGDAWLSLEKGCLVCQGAASGQAIPGRQEDLSSLGHHNLSGSFLGSINY